MQAIEFRNVRKEYQDGSQIIQALKPTNLVINKANLLQLSVHLVRKKHVFNFSRRLTNAERR